jgi:hypothetical protein
MSVISDARAALFAALDAAAAFDGVDVTYGPPVGIPKRSVAIGGATLDRDAPGFVAHANFDLTVFVFVWVEDGTAKDADDQAWALEAAVEAVVDADVTLANTVTRAFVATVSDNLALGDPGFVNLIEVTISCKVLS